MPVRLNTKVGGPTWIRTRAGAGQATDKLARAVSIVANDGENMRGVLLDIADRIMGKKAVFGIKKDHWERLAA